MESASKEMPKYSCHKQVHALQIKEIIYDTKTGKKTTIVPINADFAAFEPGMEYMEKHTPEIGGYYVVYEGGYKSYSPCDVFEKGYSLIS